jgi:acyl-CoA synthetase (AMP-forming)/AMP-acid ligase II
MQRSGLIAGLASDGEQMEPAQVAGVASAGPGSGGRRRWRASARAADEQPVARVTYSEMIAAHQELPGPALLADQDAWTWPQLLRLITTAARWLERLGGPAGAPVAALLSTSPAAIALTLAGAATGRPLAPLGPRLTERELTPCVRGIGSEFLVVEPEYSAIGERVAAAADARFVPLPELAEAPDVDLPTPGMDDLATILHTSGTTGLPKPIRMRQRMLAQRAIVNSALLRLDPSSVYASASPFHHIAGWGNVAVALGAGATIVSFPRFTVEGWRALGEVSVTHGLLVPTMIDMLLDQEALRLDTLRVLQYGAAPIHPDTLRRAMGVLPGVAFVDIYGQTEGSPITCLTADDHTRAANGHEYLLQSVGRAVPGVELRIDQPGTDGVGGLLARGPHLFHYESDGWQHTGDLGWLDEEGYLCLVGRKGEMIIRGGENVYPLEVEHVLAEHPAVADAAVVGVADQRLGETVKAYIVPAAASAPPDLGELRSFARERLAGFKVPALWEFTDALPVNASGKLMRATLVDHAARAAGMTASAGQAPGPRP